MAIDPITASIITGIIMAAVSIALSQLLAKPPDVENARPANLSDFKFPTAIEGRVVPIVFGTVKISGPNVVWWGDFRQKKITENLKTGLFTSKRIVRGFQYFIGFQAGMCRGQIDALTRVWIGDTEVFTGSIQDGTTFIDEKKLFGGDDFGNGGVQGTLRIVSGTESQTTPTYLDDNNSPSFPYRGLAYALWEGGYIGNSTQIKPWSFEVQRFPNALGLGGGQEVVNGFDANLAAVLYELLTDDDWGFGLPSSDIDIPDFQAAAATLAAEGNGFSFIMDRPMEARQFLNEVERQMDGTVFQDPLTGKFRINLVRGGFDVGLIRQITDQGSTPNIVEITEFTRGSWEETFNQIRVGFSDRSRDYFDTFEQAADIANLTVQGQKVIADISFPGIKDKSLAANVASRELRTNSTPLAKVTVVVDRSAFDIEPSEPVAFTSAALGFTQLPMRVAGIDHGELLDGRITLTLIQDIFGFASAFSAPNDPTLWTRPTQEVLPIPVAQSKVFEAPRAFTDRAEDNPGTIDRIWASGREQTGSEIRINIYQRNAAGAPSGTFTNSGGAFGFMLIGTLGADVFASRPNPTSSAIQLDPSPDVVSDLAAAFTDGVSSSDIGQNLVNLILIDDEFLAVSSITDQGTHVDLETVYGALLDTTAVDHAQGTPVYLVFAGGGLTDDTIPRGNNVEVKLRPESRTDEVTEGAASTISLTMTDRARRPRPPVDLYLNGDRYDASVQLDDQRPSTSGLDNRGIDVFYRRRDWRTFDEVLALGSGANGDPPTIVDAGDQDPTFPSANTTRYKAKLIDDPGGSPTDLFETAYNTGQNNIFLSRTKILRETGGVVPSSLRVEVTTDHVFEGEVFESAQKLAFDFGAASATLADDTNMGVIAQNVISGMYTAPVAGTYTFTLGTALATGIVEARINGGLFVTVIAATMTTGTLMGVAASDTIEVRHTEPGSNTSETFLEVDAPSGTLNGYAILTY